MKIAFIGDSLTKGIPGSSYFAILRKKLPQHRLVNLGRGNDSVISLHRRLARLRLGNEPFDLAFLWVGVNDVGKVDSWIFRAGNALRRQPRSRSLDEFRTHYQKTLALLCRHTRRVIAVAPLMKGEAIDSEWNRQIDALANIIERLTAHYAPVEYLDLRPIFYAKLADKPGSDYLQENPLRIALDILTLWTDAQVDKKAAERGLHFTLDGVHLNSAGAEIVADMFSKAVVKEQASSR
jgi:lysophospholipase L1-like esterase